MSRDWINIWQESFRGKTGKGWVSLEEWWPDDYETRDKRLVRITTINEEISCVPGRVNIVNLSLLSKVNHGFNSNPNKTFLCLCISFFLFLDIYNSPIRDNDRGMGDM